MPRLLRDPPQGRVRVVVLVIIAFLGVATVQFLRGLALGRDPSLVGSEFRIQLSLAGVLVAVPILADADLRNKLLKVLLIPGLALGLWGLAQWVFNLQYNNEFGVRAGVNYTTGGRGQLQGGLFAFPVAAVLAFAVLISGQVRSGRARLALLAIVVINLICVLLTYERSFWVATVVALVFIVLKAGRAPRVRAMLVTPIAVVVAAALFATWAPNLLTTAKERLLSLSQYTSDGSLQYRVVESRHVIEQIRTRPVVGSGLGATIYWNRPWNGVAGQNYSYTHDGYLWLAWQLGLPAALALFALYFTGIAWLRRPRGDPLFAAARNGAQGALLLLLIASVTFPSFNEYGITAIMGLLLAICFQPPAPEVPEPRPAAHHQAWRPSDAASVA